MYTIKPAYYQGIDLLRALAIIMVVIFHLKLSKITNLGWIGVDLFFVLSGFLIGGGLIREYDATNNISFLNFYKRRFLRIYPVYIFVMLINVYWNSFILDRHQFSLSLFLKQSLINMLFLQSFYKVDVFYIPQGTWSLVVEEFFYLLAPIIIFLLLRVTKNNPYILLHLLLLIFASGIVARLIINRNVLADDSNWFFAHIIMPQSRYDEITAGIIVAIIIKLELWKHLWSKTIYFSLILLIGVYFYLFNHPIFFDSPKLLTYQTYFFPTIFALLFSCMLLSVTNIKLNNKIIIFIARISYPMYLMHFFVLPEYLQVPLHFSIRLILLVIISYTVSLVVEYPFIRMYRVNTYNKS